MKTQLSETAQRLYNLLNLRTGFAITWNIATVHIFGTNHTPEQFGEIMTDFRELKAKKLAFEMGPPMNPSFHLF